MNMPTLTAVASVFLALAAAVIPVAAQAAPWPDKPVTMIVPYPPGGTSDYVGRVVADKLGAVLGLSLIHI